MPEVSVIVPNYNYGRFIGEALDSVIRQTFTDWELIVVDDNSTDDSREIVEGYIQRYPERNISLVINSRGPAGAPAPINIGVREARGEYCAWLSSDNVFEPDKLEAQVRLLDEDPAVGFVHTAYIAIDADGGQIGDFHPPDEFETDAFTALLDGNFIHGNTVLIRRDVLAEVGPFVETDVRFPGLGRASEYNHWLKIALRHPIACIDRPMLRARRHARNARDDSSYIESCLERAFILGCFEQQRVSVTPEIVASLGRRGVMSVFIETFGSLTTDDQTRALELYDDIGVDVRWFARHSAGWAQSSFRRAAMIRADGGQGVGSVRATPGGSTRQDRNELKRECVAVEEIPLTTDATLRKQLLEEIPSLGDALVTDRMLAARMLLDWASNAGNYAQSSDLAQATTDFVLTASAAEIYYDQFLPNKGAVYCSGMALFYDRVLKAFGYDSFTVNFGDMRDWLTHVAVIMPVWDDTAWKHHFFDPTFNTTFHDRETGCQLDIFELIDALDGDTMDTVVARSESMDSRDWVSIGSLKESHFFLRDVVGNRYVYGRSDGEFVDFLDRNTREFAANGYAGGLGGFVQLMRARMFSVGSCTSDAARQDFIGQLQARGIPLGDG